MSSLVFYHIRFGSILADNHLKTVCCHTDGQLSTQSLEELCDHKWREVLFI